MELKRILAKDARSANEKAVALFGPEVMVISCNKVEGQTELIVAIDNHSTSASTMEPIHTQVQAPTPTTETPAPFEDFLIQARQSAAQDIQASERQAAAQASLSAASMNAAALNASPARPEPGPSAAVMAAAEETTLAAAPEEAAGRMRGQELVSLVREEIVSLRREFQLSRLHQDVTGASSLPGTLRPLLDALIDCHVPSRLRGWLLQDMQDGDDHALALQDMRMRLHKTLTLKRPKSLMGGVHAILGRSGVGKTMMVHRIATAASREHALHDIALISYCDSKPGAWSQTQILAAQTGIDVYRARDLAALGLLIEELGDRKLILIDTPGADTMRHAADLAQLDKHIALHAVVAANATSDQFQQLASGPVASWQSLMVSKWDDMPNPWPLIDFVREQPMPISLVSDSDRANDGIPVLDTAKLVESAIFKLDEMLARNTGASVASSLKTPSAKTGTRVSKPRASRTVKTAPRTAKTASKITCLQ